MGATTTTTHSDDRGDMVFGGTPTTPVPDATPDPATPATGQLVAAMGERCVTCGAPFAPDQRYCVTCGERRGKSRFSFADVATPKVEAAPAPTSGSPPPRQRRGASGATFIAGIGTLLLAMGVGVLIGHNGNSSPQRAAAPFQVVTVGGSGGAASTGPTSTASSGPTSSSSKSSKSGKTIKPKKHPTPPKVVQQKAASAASQVLGGGAKISQPTAKVGTKGSGPGYHNGKFDGGFFGP